MATELAEAIGLTTQCVGEILVLLHWNVCAICASSRWVGLEVRVVIFAGGGLLLFVIIIVVAVVICVVRKPRR